jgi:hypothetical protein
MSFVTQISSQLSLLISGVFSLTIMRGHGPSTGEEDVDSTQWLELLRAFSHVTQFSVLVKQLV